MISRITEIRRAISKTRGAFHNWVEVGVVAGVAAPSAIPPRSGWDAVANVPTRFVTRLGPVLKTDAGNASPIIEVFRDGEYDVALPWSQMKTIIDVGAHVGSFSLWAATRAPFARLVAVEPEPRNFRDLRSNVLRNDLGSRVECLEAGLAHASGTLEINVQVQRDTTSTFASGGEVVEVTAVSLPDLVDRVGGSVDLLKVDCEGAEWEVFESLGAERWAQFGAIIVECHASGGRTIASMIDLFERHTFEVDIIDQSPSGVAWYDEIAVLVARRPAS